MSENVELLEAVDLLPALAIAFPIGFAAAFMFVATGGAGLITLPMLIFLGLLPSSATATDLIGMPGTGRLCLDRNWVVISLLIGRAENAA